MQMLVFYEWMEKFDIWIRKKILKSILSQEITTDPMITSILCDVLRKTKKAMGSGHIVISNNIKLIELDQIINTHNTKSPMTKKEFLKQISDALGPDWGNATYMTIDPDKIRINKFKEIK